MSDKNGKTNGRSENGKNGRNSKGQFVRGNPGGPGNPQAKQLAAFRAAWDRVADPAHIEEAYKFLVETFTDTTVPHRVRVDACEKFLNRTIGKPEQNVNLKTGLEEVRAGLLEVLQR